MLLRVKGAPTLLAVMEDAGSSSRTRVVNLTELPRSCSSSGGQDSDRHTYMEGEGGELCVRECVSCVYTAPSA